MFNGSGKKKKQGYDTQISFLESLIFVEILEHLNIY